MARFVVFGGSNYYPSGGFSDFLGEASSLEEAERLAISCINEQYKECRVGVWCHIADTLTRQVIWDAARDDRGLKIVGGQSEGAVRTPLARPK